MENQTIIKTNLKEFYDEWNQHKEVLLEEERVFIKSILEKKSLSNDNVWHFTTYTYLASIISKIENEIWNKVLTRTDNLYMDAYEMIDKKLLNIKLYILKDLEKVERVDKINQKLYNITFK